MRKGTMNRIIEFRYSENPFILPSLSPSLFFFCRMPVKYRNMHCLGKLRWHSKSVKFSVGHWREEDSCCPWNQTCMFFKKEIVDKLTKITAFLNNWGNQHHFFYFVDVSRGFVVFKDAHMSFTFTFLFVWGRCWYVYQYKAHKDLILSFANKWKIS